MAMAGHDESIGGLIKSVLADTRELIREEMALIREEVRHEVSWARAVGMMFGAAAVAAVLGAALLAVAAGNAVAFVVGWPVWAGYGLVALLLLVGSYLAVRAARSRLASFGALPRTRESVKENLAWIQSKSAQR